MLSNNKKLIAVERAAYASYWIKQAIRHALINTTATIRLAGAHGRPADEVAAAERAFTKEFGYPPTTDQVAVPLGLTESQRGLVEKARRARQLRLESGGGEEGRGRPTSRPATRRTP